MKIGIRSSWVPELEGECLAVEWYALNRAGEQLGMVRKVFTVPGDADHFAREQTKAVAMLREEFDSVTFVSLVHDDARCQTGRENMCNECRMIADADTCEYCGKTNPPDTRCCEEPNE